MHTLTRDCHLFCASPYESGIEDYKVLKNLNYPSFVDPVTRAQWIYNGNTFWSYDSNATPLKAISDGLK